MKNMILAILALVALNMQAIEVVNTAGELSGKITDTNITSLKVSGTMNAADFFFIADNLRHLTTVDLSEVSITACSLGELRYWQRDFDADVLPVCSFAGMELTSVSLPSGLKVIGKGAFAGCESLQTITLPAALDSIGDLAFAGCKSLTTVTLPANVQAVGNGAFMRCTALTSLKVESSARLHELGDMALMDCSALTTIDLGTTLQHVGTRALAGTGLTRVDLRGSTRLTGIGDWAMVQTPLTEAQLPTSLNSMGEGAFLYDSQLATATLGGHLSSLSDYMFAGTRLNNLDLTGVASLGDYALYNITTLSVIELPATVTWLGSYAMAGMTGLTELTSNATAVPALGENVWAGVNQKSIPLTVPASAVSRYQEAEQWKEFMFGPKWITGDVNGDGEVSVADINTLIDIILGGEFDDATMMRADVNSDGEIGLADINSVIDIILSPNAILLAGTNTDDGLNLADVAMRPGEQRQLHIVLDNAADYSGLQCDIVLPMGLSLVEATTVDGHLSETRDMDDATSRTVVYSMSKQSLGSDDQVVLTITVRADAALASESDIMLTNVVLADNDNNSWHAADCMARVSNSTGIDDLTANGDRVWLEGHVLCIETRNDGIARLTAINGITTEVKVTTGVNRIDMSQGFFVVTLNGKSHKVAIK